MRAGPSPLEVVATEPAGHIDDFADKEKTRHGAGFHGFGGKFARIHASEGDFRFGIALGAGEFDRPMVEEALHMEPFCGGPL